MSDTDCPTCGGIVRGYTSSQLMVQRPVSIAAIEAEAVRAERARLAAAVRGLAGRLCEAPDDYDPADPEGIIYVCPVHHELTLLEPEGWRCEDWPTEYVAVLALLEDEG